MLWLRQAFVSATWEPQENKNIRESMCYCRHRRNKRKRGRVTLLTSPGRCIDFRLGCYSVQCAVMTCPPDQMGVHNKRTSMHFLHFLSSQSMALSKPCATNPPFNGNIFSHKDIQAFVITTNCKQRRTQRGTGCCSVQPLQILQRLPTQVIFR